MLGIHTRPQLLKKKNMKEEEKGKRKEKVEEVWQGVHTEFLPYIIKPPPWKLSSFPRPRKPEVVGLQSCHLSVQFDHSGTELTKLHVF